MGWLFWPNQCQFLWLSMLLFLGKLWGHKASDEVGALLPVHQALQCLLAACKLCIAILHSRGSNWRWLSTWPSEVLFELEMWMQQLRYIVWGCFFLTPSLETLIKFQRPQMNCNRWKSKYKPKRLAPNRVVYICFTLTIQKQGHLTAVHCMIPIVRFWDLNLLEL